MKFPALNFFSVSDYQRSINHYQCHFLILTWKWYNIIITTQITSSKVTK